MKEILNKSKIDLKNFEGGNYYQKGCQTLIDYVCLNVLKRTVLFKLHQNCRPFFTINFMVC